MKKTLAGWMKPENENKLLNEYLQPGDEVGLSIINYVTTSNPVIGNHYIQLREFEETALRNEKGEIVSLTFVNTFDNKWIYVGVMTEKEAKKLVEEELEKFNKKYSIIGKEKLEEVDF